MSFLMLYATVMVWGIFEGIRKKKEKACYAACMGFLFYLTNPPVKIPIDFSFMGCSLLGASVLFYKWKVKKIDDSLIFFSVLFLLFGFAFFMFWYLKQDFSFFWVEPVGRALCRILT